jgi:hypothetical protein
MISDRLLDNLNPSEIFFPQGVEYVSLKRVEENFAGRLKTSHAYLLFGYQHFIQEIFRYEWICTDIHRSRNSSVGIATGYGLEGRGSNPNKDKIFPFSTTSRPALGPTQPFIQWITGAISPEIQRPGREADRSPPSSVENGGAVPPLPHISSWRSDLPFFSLVSIFICNRVVNA